MKKIQGTLCKAEDRSLIIATPEGDLRESYQYITIVLDTLAHEEFTQLMGATRLEIKIMK